MSETTVSGEPRTVDRSEILVEEGFNPRGELGDLAELKLSIERHGILVPLLVRPTDNNKVALVDGHRRLAAGELAGVERFPVLVREDLDGQALVAAMVTALKREDLDVVEEAKAYGRLIDGGLTRKGAAEAVGVAAARRDHAAADPAAAGGAVPGDRHRGDRAVEHPRAGGGRQGVAGAGRADRARVARADRRLGGRASRVDPPGQGRAVARQRRRRRPARARRRAAQEGRRRCRTSGAGGGRASAKQELDRARAAGVLYADKRDDDGYGLRSAVICDTELVRELTVTALERDWERRQRQLADDRAAQGKPEPGTPEADKAKTARKAELRASARAGGQGPRGQPGPGPQAARAAGRGRLVQGPGRPVGLLAAVSPGAGLLDRAERRRPLHGGRARRARAALRAAGLAGGARAQERHRQGHLRRRREARPRAARTSSSASGPGSKWPRPPSRPPAGSSSRWRRRTGR